MKHALALFAALILIGFAGVIVWFNRTALTIPLLSFAGGAIALAFLIAIPSDFKAAISSLAPYIPTVRGGQPPTPPASGSGGAT